MIYILLINAFFVMAYMIFCFIRNKEKKNTIMIKSLIMLLCPVIGIIFFILSGIIFRFFMSHHVDLSESTFNMNQKEIILRPDEKKSKTIVPLEEALQITDKQYLRQLMMNVIQNGDYKEVLSSISLALNSEDSETSHYAASILQDVLNEFRIQSDKLYQECLIEENQQIEHILQYIEYMNFFCRQDIFTETEKLSMVEKMNYILNIVYKKDNSQIHDSIYEMVSLRLLDLKQYTLSEIWGQRAFKQYPDRLVGYSCLLKVYFATKNQKLFKEIMNKLINTQIDLDHETLNLIRAYK